MRLSSSAVCFWVAIRARQTARRFSFHPELHRTHSLPTWSLSAPEAEDQITAKRSRL